MRTARATACPALSFNTGTEKAAVPSSLQLPQQSVENEKAAQLPEARPASPHPGTLSTSTIKTFPYYFTRPIFVEAVISAIAIPQYLDLGE